MNGGRRLAARLGLDGNSLRRRTDKIAAYGVLVLLAVFLAGAPVLSVSAGHWAYRTFGSELRQQRAWSEVTAVLLQAAPVDPGSLDVVDSWTRARWTPPGGHARDGTIQVPAGTPAGSRIRIWVDDSGRWAGLPVGGRMVALRVAVAVVAATILLAAALAAVASFARWWLDRRRLAAWEADWKSVGPRWTRQFWAGG